MSALDDELSEDGEHANISHLDFLGLYPTTPVPDEIRRDIVGSSYVGNFPGLYYYNPFK